MRRDSGNRLKFWVLVTMCVVMNCSIFVSIVTLLHSYFFSFTLLSLLFTFIFASELRSHTFTAFRTMKNFVDFFDNFCFLDCREHHPTFFRLEKFFIVENCFFLVSKKVEVKVLVRIRAKFRFFAAWHCYLNTNFQAKPKRLKLLSWWLL